MGHALIICHGPHETLIRAWIVMMMVVVLMNCVNLANGD
jgi:hypothetical protein